MRKEENRFAVFRINVPARDGRISGGHKVTSAGRGPLMNLHDQRETLWTPRVEFTRRVENTNETDVPSVWEVDSG